MYKILKLNSISKEIYSVLDDKYITSDTEASPDGILVRSAAMHEMPIPSGLKAVARAGAGVNNIPLAKMAESNVVVFNTPGANANAVKELVIAGMLLASRDIVGGVAWSNSLTGDDVAKQVEKGKGQFGGTEIFNKTLGVVGLGAIGILVSNVAINLGMKVLGYDPFLSTENQAKLDKNVRVVGLEEIFSKADFVTLHVPLLDSTRAMINQESLAKMKPTAVILNYSRAELVNNTDIKMALEAGKLRRYVVDFPTPEVLNCKGIIPIPHLGASTEEAEDNCAIMAAEELKNYLELGNIVNSVNFPNVSMPVQKLHRVIISYKADKISKESIMEVLSNLEVICASKERANIGYIIVESDNCMCEAVEQLNTMEGVLATQKF